MGKILDSVKGFFAKIKAFFVKIVDWFKKKTEHVKWKEVWDKCTTGILILLMASHIIILGYILLWFIFK